MKRKILTIKNLSKRYHDKTDEIKALDNISFDVYEKEFIAIVGPSGCGKSTILSILSELEKKDKLTKENKQYVLDLLKTYGLYEFKDKYPSSLSGGMRQRVALIRTLAIKPDILLLDEPMSALDYQSRLAISDDIYKIIKNEGKTAIMVTHDIAEAISMSDRIIVLTKRPARVKTIYEINLTNKSTPINNRKCKEFSTYYDTIWRDLDVHI